MTIPLPYYEIKRGRFPRRYWYFILRAENGEIIATSEHYTTLASTRTGIASVRFNALDAGVVDWQ